MKLVHTSITAKGMDDSSKFYTEELGLKLFSRRTIPEDKAEIAFSSSRVFLTYHEAGTVGFHARVRAPPIIPSMKPIRKPPPITMLRIENTKIMTPHTVLFDGLRYTIMAPSNTKKPNITPTAVRTYRIVEAIVSPCIASEEPTVPFQLTNHRR